MIIYPAQHKIIGENELSPGDIQLAYIDANNIQKEYKVINVNHKSSVERLESVYPYEGFDRPDPYLFDKNKNLVSVAPDMMRTESGYAFFPAEAVEFSPELFDFRVSVKKHFFYESNRPVDIKVGVIEKDRVYAESLIKIFGDAYRKNLITSNFKVNSGDIKIESLTNLSIEECDLVFIESNNTKTYWDSEEIIDFNEILDDHTNIWLCIGDSNALGVAESYYEFSNDFTLIGNTIYGENRFKDIKLDSCINENEIQKAFPDFEYIENVYLYDVPVAILHKKDKGFLFVSHKSAVLNAEKNYKLIYEILNYVYTQGYSRTKWISGWITDHPVDYIPRRESIFGRNHEQYLINELLGSRLHDGDTVTIVNIKIVQDDKVSLKGIGTSNEIFFEKIGGEKDPEKSTGQRSYYTTRRTVILYTENAVNRLETPLKFSIKATSKGDYIHIDEFKSTSLETNITEKTVLRIPDTFATYCIVLKENIFTIKRLDHLNESDGYVILVFELRKKSSIKSHDVRVPGGGLPEKSEGNYNLFDIGHVKGRPYRRGGTMVIELPKRLQEFESYIRNAVERHIVSGEHYILVYKEQEA